MRIGQRLVGLGEPTYFIADIAANHDGDLDRALMLIEMAAEAGADAAKFQNFSADTIVSAAGFAALGAQVSHQANWTKSVVEIYEDATLPVDWTPALAERCAACGIDYMTAPYSLALINQLDAYVCAWKVGSGDITWIESVEAMAATGKPIIIATGASSLDDVDRAVEAASRHTREIAVLQCNTNYTASAENFRFISLAVLNTYRERYPHAVLGLSDHTAGPATTLGAIALGGRIIEKHFTDDRTRVGPDHRFSVEPVEWRDMVDLARELEAAMGSPEKRVMDNERETVVVQRRAIRAGVPLRAGVTVQRSDLEMLRPCPTDGIAPFEADRVVGRRLVRDLDVGDHLRWEDLD